jgi:hypothetical protein
VSVQHIRIHGEALEGNLGGNAVDRDVFVFLPPSYGREPNRLGCRRWTAWAEAPDDLPCSCQDPAS